MTRLTENYLREVDASLRVDAARKRQIVDELRGHLQEKVNEVRAQHPESSSEDVERQVLADFGSPRDLALAYEPEGTAVLKNAAGDTVLRVGEVVGRGARAAGRGLGKLVKAFAIALAVLLVLALGVGAWAYYELKDVIPAIAEESNPVFAYAEECGGTPCDGALPAGTFFVKPEARDVRFSFSLSSVHVDDSDTHQGHGSVRIAVSDPAGNVQYNRTFSMANETRVDHQATWAAVGGNWTVSVEFVDFVGELDVEAYALSAPWRDL